MHFVTYANCPEDISELSRSSTVKEVLLEPVELSFEGRVSLEQVVALAKFARESGLAPVLVWDILMCEEQASELFAAISEIDLGLFSSVRVRDLGAAQYLLEHNPNTPIQLLVEADNHNLDGLLGWCEYFGTQLDRLVLSIELPEAKLIEYCEKLPVDCEVLGAGRIELFYTPRGLLSMNFESSTRWIEVTASAQDSGQRPFPILETEHGTKMFLDKDQFILDKLDALEAAGIAAIRIDAKHLTEETSNEARAAQGVRQLCNSCRSDADSRKRWPRKTLAPFFKTNKTTARFAKLKSPLHVMRDESCLAQLLYGEKGNYLVFYSLRNFDVNEAATLVLTTGEAIGVEALGICDPAGQTVSRVEANKVFTSPWVRKASTGALLTTNKLT